MALTDDGYLGVGTTQPDDNLTIEDPNGSGDGAEIDISGLYMGRYNGGEGYISDLADEPFTIYTNNGTGFLTINNLGSVGIDTNPDTDFTIGDTGNDGISEIDNAYGLYLGSDNVGDAWLAANDSTGISFQVGGADITEFRTRAAWNSSRATSRSMPAISMCPPARFSASMPPATATSCKSATISYWLTSISRTEPSYTA